MATLLLTLPWTSSPCSGLRFPSDGEQARAWRYLHVVAALNWWKAILDHHAWGDKDTWALAAVILGRAERAVSGAEPHAEAHASTAGTLVGWLTRTASAGPFAAMATPPAAVWGHVQFDASREPDGAGMLYLNWQPHYAAGFIRVQTDPDEPPPAFDLSCCVLLRDHWAGPHDELPLWPTTAATASHARVLQRTFADAREALGALGAAPLVKPHWWGQVRYRRCTIYYGVLGGGLAFAMRSAWASWWALSRQPRRSARSAV